MAEVKLTTLTKAYPGGVVAVNNVDLLIPDGQFTVLVGPSGCGKSTTLRMVAGLEEITSGTISIDEKVVNDVLPKDRDIAMVFQDYALYPHMDVYKNMAFGLKLRKFPRQEIDQRVREAAKVLGLEKLLARKPRELSGGQRQRVAVGRAIVRRPKVFLFDEPLSNLDAKLRVEMRAELKRLHRQLKTTTIYVTHDQEEAMTLGDRVVVMKDGVVQQVGAPLDIYQAPVNRFVGSFLGTPPMNFVNGKVIDEGGKLIFDLGSSKLQLTDAHAVLLKNYVNQELVLGIRPESIGLKADGRFAGVGNSLPAQITVSEPLGEKIDVYFTIGDHRMIARVDAQRGLDDAKAITIYVDMEKVHIFDQGELGANLTLPHAEAIKEAAVKNAVA